MQKDTKTIQKAIQKALEERGITITDLQMNILVFFYLNPTATRNDYISSDSNISEGGTKSSIARLQELELLKRKGGKKNGEWIVDIGTFYDSFKKQGRSALPLCYKELFFLLQQGRHIKREISDAILHLIVGCMKHCWSSHIFPKLLHTFRQRRQRVVLTALDL
jgi:hypothetical protein